VKWGGVRARGVAACRNRGGLWIGEVSGQGASLPFTEVGCKVGRCQGKGCEVGR